MIRRLHLTQQLYYCCAYPLASYRCEQHMYSGTAGPPCQLTHSSPNSYRITTLKRQDEAALCRIGVVNPCHALATEKPRVLLLGVLLLHEHLPQPLNPHVEHLKVGHLVKDNRCPALLI